jgi:two-component system, NarL family, invasion response regulator UvrY
MIRILLVDSYQLVREGVRQLLHMTPDLRVTGEAADGPTTLTLLHTQPFDVVVLEIMLPGQSGLHWLKVMKTEQPALPVLILTVECEQHYAVRCLRAGAAGYLTKYHASSELLTAIRHVAAGQKYITPTVAAELTLALESHPHPSAGTDLLSDRELEVLIMLADGHSVSEIAKYLLLSVKTVSTYRTRLLLKLHVNTTAALIRYAIQEGMTTQSPLKG